MSPRVPEAACDGVKTGSVTTGQWSVTQDACRRRNIKLSTCCISSKINIPSCRTLRELQAYACICVITAPILARHMIFSLFISCTRYFFPRNTSLGVELAAVKLRSVAHQSSLGRFLSFFFDRVLITPSFSVPMLCICVSYRPLCVQQHDNTDPNAASICPRVL